MRKLIYIPLSLCLLFLTGCSGKYTEDELETFTEAETVHYETLNAFGDAYNQMAQMTELQDSLSHKIDRVNQSIQEMDSENDSLTQVREELSTAMDQLTSAKNDLLGWTDEAIYDLPDMDKIFTQNTPERGDGIGKDQQNPMIMNNFKYKELPEDIRPEELLSLKEEQYKAIETIRQTVEASIEEAKNTLAKNL